MRRRSVPQFDLSDVETGIQIKMVDRFLARSRLSVSDLEGVVISSRTLHRRRMRQRPLSLHESDRLAQMARIYLLAVRVFGNARRVRRRLRCPEPGFAERTPLSLLRTGAGGHAVEQALYEILESARMKIPATKPV